MKMIDKFELNRYTGEPLRAAKGKKQWQKYLDEQSSILYEPNAEELLDEKGLQIQAMIENVFRKEGVPYTTEIRNDNDNNRLIVKAEMVEIYPIGRLNWQMGLGNHRLMWEPSLVNDELTYKAIEELTAAIRDERLVKSEERDRERFAG